MSRSSARPPRLDLPWSALRAPASETLLQVALVGGAAVIVGLLPGPELAARATGMFAFAAAVAASILLAVGAGISDNRRARRVAGAVAIYAGVVLFLPAVGATAPLGVWAVTGDVAVLGVVGLLVLAVRASSDRRGDRITAVAVVVLVGVATAAVAGTGALAPERVPSPVLVAAVDLVAWSGTAAAALVLLLAGTVADRALLRRTGLAFATLACAHAVRIVAAGDGIPGGTRWVAVLEVAAFAMLLVAAVPFLLEAVRVVSTQQARLAEAEAAMAGVAERDHELRSLVAGLSGAADVLTEGGTASDGHRLLVAAGTQLQRLRRMLDGDAPPTPHAGSAVGTVLHDLALVHRANGVDVRVDVQGDPRVAVDGGVLAQVLTTLLADCARHAPEARVRLRAGRTGHRVRVEVADDGPEPRPGWPARGTGEAGPAVAVSAEWVERHHGTVTVASDLRGFRVLLDLPAAERGASLERVGA